MAIWGSGGGGGASIIRPAPSWFISTLSLIIIYMSNIEQSEDHIFAYKSVSKIDLYSDKMLVSKPMFMWMRNPMITLKIPIG